MRRGGRGYFHASTISYVLFLLAEGAVERARTARAELKHWHLVRVP